MTATVIAYCNFFFFICTTGRSHENNNIADKMVRQGSRKQGCNKPKDSMIF
jgi:hypothetical protein